MSASIVVAVLAYKLPDRAPTSDCVREYVFFAGIHASELSHTKGALHMVLGWLVRIGLHYLLFRLLHLFF